MKTLTQFIKIPLRLARKEPVSLLEAVWFIAALIIICAVTIYHFNPNCFNEQ